MSGQENARPRMSGARQEAATGSTTSTSPRHLVSGGAQQRALPTRKERDWASRSRGLLVQIVLMRPLAYGLTQELGLEQAFHLRISGHVWGCGTLVVGPARLVARSLAEHRYDAPREAGGRSVRAPGGVYRRGPLVSTTESAECHSSTARRRTAKCTDSTSDFRRICPL